MLVQPLPQTSPMKQLGAAAGARGQEALFSTRRGTHTTASVSVTVTAETGYCAHLRPPRPPPRQR